MKGRTHSALNNSEEKKENNGVEKMESQGAEEWEEGDEEAHGGRMRTVSSSTPPTAHN